MKKRVFRKKYKQNAPKEELIVKEVPKTKKKSGK
jgi:hypothetical protein